MRMSRLPPTVHAPGQMSSSDADAVTWTDGSVSFPAWWR